MNLIKNIFLVVLLCIVSKTMQSQEITLIASNHVGNGQIIHTLKLASNNSGVYYSDDVKTSSSLNKNIQSYIELVENKNGVIRITFDNSTNSFSILSDTTFNIQNVINTNNSINTNLE